MNLLKLLTTILFTFIIIFDCNAQTEEAFEELNSMLAEFDNGDEMIRQEFSLDSDKPYEIVLTRVLTDSKKGKEKKRGVCI